MIINEIIKQNLKALVLFLVITFLYFYSDLFYYLAHDEIPPYYGTAMHFYNANSFSDFYKLIINSSYTFGHPFIFPFIYGVGMKVWGLGSFAAKIFIVCISSISLFSIYKLSTLIFKNIFYSLFIILLSYLSIVYTINLPLFLGDTFLLPFCLFYTYFYLREDYYKAIIIALVAGLVRESFLLFYASFFVLEAFYFCKHRSISKNKRLFLLISPLSSILWFLINKIKYGSFLHTFVNVDLAAPQESGIRFSLDFFLSNTGQFWKDMINIDPFLLVNLLVFIFSFIHYKRLNPLARKFKLLTLAVFFVTYIALSFFHGFYLRYLLYAYILVFIANISWVQTIYQKKIKYLVLILFLVLIRGIKNDIEAGEFGRLATQRYEETISEFNKMNITTDYIYLCFPYRAYICNYKYVYPNSPDKRCIENLNEVASGSEITLICRNPIEDYNINYEKYFKHKSGELIYKSENTLIENLSAWKYNF
jgi:hypothetical protein